MRSTASVVVLFLAAAACLAQEAKPLQTLPPAKAERLADDDRKGFLETCKGFQCDLEENYGTRIGILLNYQGQLLLNGPRREDKGKSAYSHRLDLIQGLWSGGELVVTGEGGSGRGLDEMLGTFLGTNDDAGEERCLYVSRAYLNQKLLDDKLSLAAGKLDLSDFFDLNYVANTADEQFLSSSLVNNPTIPFTDYAIGVVAMLEPADWLYVQAGVADAQGVGTQMGTNTAFHEEDYFVSMYELGLRPKAGEFEGNYRFLVWYDPQPLDRFEGGQKRDDVGLALSFDQQVTQRVTLFARYGFAHQQVREISNFWSFGGELAAPLLQREDDAAGLAVGQAILSEDMRRADGLQATETIFETYYRIHVNDYIHISPDLQVILNPAGQDSQPAVIAGIRAVFVF